MRDRFLDIVIIGKNEDKSLRKTFESVIFACKTFEEEFKQKPNVIYIDSCSTDNSVKIANDYHIKCKIITGTTSPSHGRIEGVRETDSKYVFFLDGDTEVEEYWLNESVGFLEKNENIAGVGGKLIFNMYNSENKLIWQNKNYRNNRKAVENIYDGVGGTFLYKRKPYCESGGFSINYRISEEFDLMLRIVSLGYKVKRLNTPMGIHNDYKTVKVNYFKRYLFTKEIFISGKVCRNSPITSKTLNLILLRYWLYILHLPIILTIIGLLLSENYLLSIIMFLVLVCFHLMYKKFNLKRAALSIFSMLFYSLGFYVGLLRK